MGKQVNVFRNINLITREENIQVYLLTTTPLKKGNIQFIFIVLKKSHYYLVT